MELREFLEKFLPDYDERLEVYKKKTVVEEEYQEDCFNSKHFPEALQNFANLICEKQRGNCAEAMSLILDETGTMLMDCDFYRICDAEQPNLEDNYLFPLRETEADEEKSFDEILEDNKDVLIRLKDK